MLTPCRAWILTLALSSPLPAKPVEYDMAPETRPEVVQAAVAMITSAIPAGPVEPTWESLEHYYRVPQWMADAKFGLFMHWGLYAVPAFHNEWYEKHMYATLSAWHTDHFGPQEKFGYKDFIPLFTAEKFDPAAWARLFRESGAKYVIPTAQHHDGFALWDSAVTPFNAKLMGPKRDLIGDLAKAVRAEGLKFGVSNHGIENFQFVNPTPELAVRLKAAQADLYDPKWAEFYHVADRSDAACEKFLVDWYARTIELIDQYQPDILWFDNGIDIRYLDPLKLRVAAYYYNRAAAWGKEVTLNTKKAAYAPSGKDTAQIGTVLDFEKIGSRSPAGIRAGVWDVDEPIGSTWGYTSGMTVAGPAAIVAKLVDTVSRNGTFLLNLSPRADGTIPEAQQATLRGIGAWLRVNGEAIYASHNWTQYRDEKAAVTVRFTVRENQLYAIIVGPWPRHPIILPALSGLEPSAVRLVGSDEPVKFAAGTDGLSVTLPPSPPCDYAYTLRISGMKLPPFRRSLSGNP